MISTRRRLRILLIVIISMGIALSSVVLARVLNLGTNLQDPLYFNSPTHSQFLYNNGSQVTTLDFDSIPIDSNHAICNITLNGEPFGQFNVTPDGRYIDPLYGETNNYTIFWVHIVVGAGSETVSHIGHNYSIFDPIGILGAPNSEYNLTITEKYVYWAERPGLNGAQFSLKFVVRDLTGVLIAEGEMDYTCGMLFVLSIGSGNLRTLELTDTNYDISRNRLTGWPITLIIAVAAPALAFCFLHFYKKESLEKNLETTLLIAFGEIAFVVDIFVDVWMYAPLGFVGNLILHAVITGIFAIYALWRKVGLKWVIPAVLEIAFLVAMVGATSDSYVPHLTAFMGIMISWLCLLWVSGYERVPSKSKLGKIISEFV
jgi:hypothetical protein